MKPWSKLWRRESPRFRARPLAARAIAAYVLKHVDAEGRLPLGGRDAVTAVALAVGADAGERRWLRPAVHELLEHGYLVVEDEDIVVRNFPKYQDEEDRTRRESNPNATRTGREHDASRTRTRREPVVNTTRVEPERDARIDSSVRNDSVARDVLSSEREERREKREERREREDQARARPLAHDERIEMHEIESMYSRVRSSKGLGTWKRSGSRGYDVLQVLTDWTNDLEQGATREERRTACEEAMLGHLLEQGDKIVQARWPLTWLHDPGAMRANYQAHVARAKGELSKAERTDPITVAQQRFQRATAHLEAAERSNDAGARADALAEYQAAQQALFAAKGITRQAG